MAWCRTERAIRLVLCSRVDRAEAAAPGGIARTIEPQLVEPLLIELQRALGSGQLELDLHLAALRDPARFQGARTSALEANQRTRHVIDFDRTGLSPSQRCRAPRHNRLHLARHFCDRSD